MAEVTPLTDGPTVTVGPRAGIPAGSIPTRPDRAPAEMHTGTRVGFRARLRLRRPERALMIALAVVPLVLFYGVFVVFPMVWSFYMSVHNWPGATLVRDPQFVGLQNYEVALTLDRLFRKALVNTGQYVVLSIPLNILSALFLAVTINSRPRFRGVYRTLYFLPVLVSEVTASILWRYVYQPRIGLINSTLIWLSDTLHLDLTVPRWLDDPALAMPSVVFMTVWKSVGYTIVIILAGLQGVPQTLYEAARVDGAAGWRLFRHITLPLLRPTMVFLLVTQTIGSLQIFAPMFVMTRGGPVDATRTVVFHLYEQAFGNFRFGYASSLAVLLFFLILALTLVQVRFLRTRWEY